MDKKEYTGFVLAGGKNSRMGRVKGLIPWKGITLVEQAVKTISPFCNEILISANDNKYDFLGHRVIPDQYPDAGPLGGILSCLKYSDTDRNLVIPVDTPLLTTEIYSRLLEEDGGYDMLVCVDHESHYQPLCSIFSKSLIPVIENQIQNEILGIHDLIRMVSVKEVSFSTETPNYNPRSFYNINSPADLEQIADIS